MLLDKIFVIWFKDNEKHSLYFYYHFSFFIWIFLFFRIHLVWKVTHIHLRDLFYPKYLKTYEKTKYTFPSSWNNLVHGRRTAKISKQHKRFEKKKKKLIQIRSGKHRLKSEFEASQNPRGSLQSNVGYLEGLQAFKPSMLQARSLMLPNVGYLKQYDFLLLIN